MTKPETLTVQFQAEEIAVFDTHQRWVNKASSQIGGYRSDQKIICLDKNGNCLTIGTDFRIADEKGLFPVKAYRLVRTSEVNQEK